LIRRPARSAVYAEVSTRIMQALDVVTPDIEVFSVDEAFLDVTCCQRLHGTPARMAQMAKDAVFRASGLRCSVGVAGDKTTAKFAAKQRKPDGFTVIPPWEARDRLRDVPVTALCGIAEGIGTFLAARGVRVCGDMHRVPVSALSRRFGNLGRRIWLMCQGLDPDKVHTGAPEPKSMGHGKVLPPNTRDRDTLLTYLSHMSERLAARLRRHQREGRDFWIGLRTSAGWIGDVCRVRTPTADGKQIYRLCLHVLATLWRGQGLFQVQITALDPKPGGQQSDLFEEDDDDRMRLNTVMDRINDKYGEFTLAPGNLINRSDMPNVISPAWKPYGHRQTI
jgi:DNA polymerase-4